MNVRFTIYHVLTSNNIPNAVAESIKHRIPHVEGLAFKFQLSQINDLLNVYLSLPNLLLGTNRIAQGQVCTISGQYDSVCHGASSMVSLPGQNYRFAMSVHCHELLAILI